jgi:AcrR family transcriptional regulator
MGRRSDHTRHELRALLLAEGHKLLAEQGLAKFSGREVAKRAGYSVGTIYNVFGSLDRLILALNSSTFSQWADFLRQRLEQGGPDRIRSLVEGYFDFALAHPKLWSAIYDHRVAKTSTRRTRRSAPSSRESSKPKCAQPCPIPTCPARRASPGRSSPRCMVTAAMSSPGLSSCSKSPTL